MKNSTYIYDTGSSKEAFEYIQNLRINTDDLKVVISHFHPDHTGNIALLKYDELYLSNYTKQHIKKDFYEKDHNEKDYNKKDYNKKDYNKKDHYGNYIEISNELTDRDIKIVPFVSSHAKGSLILSCKDYMFAGDAFYPAIKKDGRYYNIQFLKQQIEFLTNSTYKYICLSHKKQFIYNKEYVIGFLKDIYSKRNKNSPYIIV